MAESTAAIVLLYRNWPGVRDTLDSLLASDSPPGSIIVVDNGSDRSDLEDLRQTYPAVTVLVMENNGGYAAAMNAGAAHAMAAGARTLLLLTHDVLLEPGCVMRLEDLLEGGAGVAGPLLLRRDDPSVVWSAGGTLSRRSGRPDHLLGNAPAHAVGPPRVRDVDWLDGAVLLLSAETFTRVGGLATDYFLYWEEVDLQLRVRRLGLPVRIDLGSRAQQAPGMAPPYLDARNSTLVLWRHGMRAALPASWWRQVRAGLGAAKRGEPWQLVARAAGVRDSVTGRMSSRWRLRRSAPRVGDL